jgi:hypothetical protein
MVVAALLAAPATSASAPAATNRQATEGSNARAASTYIHKVLNGLPLPAGATRVADDRSTGHELRSLPSQPAIGHFIDVHRFYTVAGTPNPGYPVATPDAVIKAIEASPPKGYTVSGTGSSGNVNTGPSMWFVTLMPKHLPAGIFQAGVVYSAAATSGGVALRVDSSAVPLTPRPIWERVPPSARALTITAVNLSGKTKRTLGTVTSAAKLTQVIRLINSLPIIQPGTVIGCPAILSTSTFIRLSFGVTASSTPLAVATETGCDGIAFTVGSRTGGPLQETVDLGPWLKQHHVLPADTVYPST